MSNVGTYPTHTADGEVLTAQYVNDLVDDVQNKVAKVEGKGLSTNDYTTAEKTKLASAVTGVKVNGASVVTDGVANIPIASSGVPGTVRIGAQYGLTVNSGGTVFTNKATDAEIAGKTHEFDVIVPKNLDKAIMEGLGNNSLTWSDTYKQNARATLGITSGSALQTERL